ncbi:MAG: hypothetical protein KGR25_00860, partial [Chloroflexi bacterium]|nr:hypothetical protein [Chloroflexota bacterium]
STPPPVLARIASIHTEVAREAAYEGAGLFDEMRVLMADAGFRLRVVRWGLVFGNALFIRDGASR